MDELLPFDPQVPLPFTPVAELDEDERAAAAAHAHYNIARLSYDLLATSGYLTELAGCSEQLIVDVEQQAAEDDDSEAADIEESAETASIGSLIPNPPVG